jgi:integrase
MAPRRSRGPRRYGVGTYDTTSDGRHRWRYTTTLATGQKKRVDLKARELADLDRKVEAFLDVEKRLGYALDVEQRTVAQYCTAWLEQRVAVRNTPSTHLKYENDLARLLPYIGDVKLRLLRPDHIQAAIRALTQRTKEDGTPHYRPMTIQDTVRTLHNALEPLVASGVLSDNPARSKLIDLPANDQPYEPVILTADELLRLFQAARDTWIEVLLHTYAMTGLRRGEALGLRWEDLDFAAGHIYPRQTVKLVGNRTTIGTLKTRASRQSVPMTEDLAAWLQLQRERVLTMQIARRHVWHDHDLVFPATNGKPWEPHNMSHMFKRILAQAGLPLTVTIHGLRHSYGTLVAQHYNARVVQRLLRHANVATTYRYIHSDTSQEQAAAKTVAELLKQRG